VSNFHQTCQQLSNPRAKSGVAKAVNTVSPVHNTRGKRLLAAIKKEKDSGGSPS
jgi:hypothetical protein